jgi:hypothetical protein
VKAYSSLAKPPPFSKVVKVKDVVLEGGLENNPIEF